MKIINNILEFEEKLQKNLEVFENKENKELEKFIKKENKELEISKSEFVDSLKMKNENEIKRYSNKIGEEYKKNHDLVINKFSNHSTKVLSDKIFEQIIK